MNVIHLQIIFIEVVKALTLHNFYIQYPNNTFFSVLESDANKTVV